LCAEKRQGEALEAFAKSVALNPHVAETHADLGIALAQNGKIPQAVYELNYALRLNPKLASAHFALGNVYMNQQAWRDALKSLKASVRPPRSQGEAERRRGAIHFRSRAGRASNYAQRV
jgi:Flp pilus assembly protein TadD